jgi:ribosome assembly protein YihI (activator of Der GTPase)
MRENQNWTIVWTYHCYKKNTTNVEQNNSRKSPEKFGSKVEIPFGISMTQQKLTKQLGLTSSSINSVQ